MEELEYEKQKLKKVEDELKVVKEGEEKILKELPKKYGNNPVLLSNLMSSTATKIANIQRIKEKPYFARIDFKENGKSIKDKLYIGKIGIIDLDGKIIVTDWRAPVSTLYYDSNLGNVEYNAPDGKILETDVVIAKNYLSEEEIKELNNLVSMYLDFAERQVKLGHIISMQEWKEKLEMFLNLNEYNILKDNGKIKREIADKLALDEYEKYRVVQDHKYISDFDELVLETKNIDSQE